MALSYPIFLIVFSILIIALVNLAIGRILLNRLADIKTLNFVNIFIASHCAFLIASNLFFFTTDQPNNFSPFILFYGPLFYFTIVSIYNVKPIVPLWIHGIPFILATLGYLYVKTINIPADNLFARSFPMLVLVTTAISLISYVTLPFYNLSNQTQKVDDEQLYVITFTRILLSFIAVLLFTIIANKELETQPEAANMIQALIYLCFLVMAIILFVFSLQKAKKYFKFHRKSNGRTAYVTKTHSTKKYQKSLINSLLMEKYATKISVQLEHRQYFKEPKLSIEKLSMYLKIPPHHLTQVLNIYYNQSFNDYINKQRIEYANKLLLEQGAEVKIEEIATAAGFTSRVSFNRHFKLINQCTPTEYLQSHVINTQE